MSDDDRNGRIVDVQLNVKYDKRAYDESCNILEWKIE